MNLSSFCGYTAFFTFQVGLALLTDSILYPSLTGIIAIIIAYEYKQREMERRLRGTFFYSPIPTVELAGIAEQSIQFEVKP